MKTVNNSEIIEKAYEDYFVPTEYHCSECNYQRYLDF